MRGKAQRAEWIGAAFLVVVALAFYWPATLFGLSPGLGDVPLQFLPWKSFWRESLLSGRVPLWNPHVACGAPFLANFQSAVFNPVDWLLLPVPVERFFGVSLLVHTILALLFTYGLARKLGVSVGAGVIAALAFGLSGFNHIHLFAGNFLTFSATVWLPLLWWMLAGLIGSVRRSAGFGLQLRWSWGVCVAIVLQVLAGHPQMLFYSLVFSALWGLALVWPGRVGRVRRISRTTALCALAGVVAAGVCAVQLLPTLEYAGWSSRAQHLGWEEATQFSFSPTRLLTLPLPDFFGSHATGDYWGHWKDWSSAYVGVWPCLLAAVALARRRRAGRREAPNAQGTSSGQASVVFPTVACIVVGTVALLLAFGRHNPLYQLLLSLPGFGHFRAPAKFLPYFILALSLLAGAGWDVVRQMWRAADAEHRLLESAKWLFLLAILVIGATVTLLAESPGGFGDHWRTLGRACGVAAAVYLFGLVAVVGGFNLRGQRRAMMVLFVAVVLGDLYLYGRKYFRFSDPLPRWQSWQRFLEPVRRAPAGSGRLDAGGLLEPNEAIPVGVEVAGLYDPLSVRHYAEWVRYYEGLEPREFSDGLEPRRLHGPAPWLLNLRFFVVMPRESGGSGVLSKLPGEQQLLVDVPGPGEGNLKLYRWEGGFPRVVFYPEEAARFSPFPWGFEPSRELYLARGEEPGAVWPPPSIRDVTAAFQLETVSLPEQPRIDVRRLSPEEWQVAYQSPQAGYLFFSEVFYPGWKCIVDGERELEVLRANHAFRAVKVPQGRHSLRMVYEPKSYLAGKRLSLIGLVLLVLWIGWSRFLDGGETTSA